MAWFCNHYRCDRCGREWADEWSCTCEDDCPHCGARHMTPYDSDDVTAIIQQDGGAFVVLRSLESAGHEPTYREIGRFSTRQEAESFLAAG